MSYLLARLLFVSPADLVRARTLTEQSVDILKKMGAWHHGYPLGLLREIYLTQGELETARALLEESLALCKEIIDGGGGDAVEFRVALARLSLVLTDLLTARDLYQEGLAFLSEGIYKEFVASCLEGLGAVM